MTSLAELATEAATCTRCDLYKCASGTVFGQGPDAAALMLVGETPEAGCTSRRTEPRSLRAGPGSKKSSLSCTQQSSCRLALPQALRSSGPDSESGITAATSSR